MLPVPNGERSFVDLNGQPYVGGLVYSYVPGTTTPSNTYVDEGMTTPNPNPVTLDGAGRAVMWIPGLIRQILYDMFGNLIWDQETGFSLDNYQGNFTLDGNLTVNGSSTFNGPVQDNSSLTVAGPSNLAGGTSTTSLTATGPTNLSGGANITGGLTADSINDTGPLTVAGTTDLNGDLNVAGDTVMNGNDTIGGNLGVVGSSDLNGPTVTSSLGVTGNATIDGNLTVGGTITGGGGGGTPTPQVQILPIRVIGNVGSDTASTSDGLIVWEYGQGGVPDNANINFTLPTAPQGQVIYYKLGLLSYEGQSSVGESPLANVNWYANTIDGQAPPYNFEEAGIGNVFSFINVNGADDWLIFTTG